MRGPKEKLKRLVEEKEQILKYLERLNAQVQDGSLDAKERNFLISLKTMGLPPHEYLIRLNNQILHTSRYDETRAKTIKHASMVAGLFLFLAMFFYAFINPTLTGLVGLGNDQEFELNINQNYTNGTTEYSFNINDVGNNTNNLTSLRITGTYSGSFIIKLVSDVEGMITEYVVYEPPVSDNSENMITGYAVREKPKTIEINDTEIQEPDVNDTEIDNEIIEPIINDTDVNESGIDEPIVNDSEIIKLIINDTDVNESGIDEPFVNETGIITDFILPFTTITDVCIDTCNIEISPKNLSIVIEVIDGEFYLNKIIFTQAVINQAPVQIKNIPDIYGPSVINLSEYFYDPDGDALAYDLMSNPELEYSLDDNLLTINPISLTPQNFYVYSTDGDTVTISNTFKVYSQTQIPQEILDALLQDSSVRVIVKTQTNGVLLTSGKGDKSLRTTGLEDVGLDYSRMMGKKVLVTDENVPIEIMREVGDLKSVVVDLNLLNQLSIMPDIEEIVLDSKYSPLTNNVLNITKIESTKNAGYSGLGIKVCVLDTGLSSALGYSSTGYNFVNNNIDYSDVNGHGTNVVYSLINSAPGIDLIVAKVIDDSGNGYASDILAGLNYCAAQNASIISMSIGAGSSTGYCDDDLVSQKVNELNDAGILVVVATGNDGSTDSVKIPSCASGALPVGASTKSSSIAGFSNYNNATLLVAPGQDVITKDIFGNDVSVSGTSISVPFVSGTAALLLENELLDSEELKELIVHTGDLIDYNGRRFAQLNAWNALIRNYTNNLTANTIFGNSTTENYTILNFPTYEDYGTASSSIIDTITPSYPATVNENDLLIAAVVSGTGSTDIVFPVGWTEVNQTADSAPTGAKMAWAWRRADGTETGTINITQSGNVQQILGVIARYSGVITTGTPFDNSIVWWNNALANVNSSEITTQGTNRTVVVIGLCEDNREIDALGTYERDLRVTTTVGGQADISFFHQNQSTVGTIVEQTSGVLFGTEHVASFTFDLLPITSASVLYPNITNFDGSTTNFTGWTSEQLRNASNVVLEMSSFGNIKWNNNINVEGANFDSHIQKGIGFIYVNSSALNSTLNSSANLTLYNIPESNVVILRDGVPCTTCTFIDYSGGNYSFQVQGFSNYSLTMNVTLISPSNGASSVTSPVFFVANVVDVSDIVNATLYTNESGWAARETRWNGEVAWNDTGLVALYHFNNESAFGENDTYMRDLSGNGNNLSCIDTCPPYASGKFGLAQFKDNTYNSFSAPDNNYYSNLSYLTIIAWVNPLRNQSEQSGDGYIVEKRHDGTGGNWNTFYLEVYSNNGVIFNVLNETGDGVEYAWGAENSTLAGRWTMIAGRYNGTHLDTFVNGVKDTVSEYPFAGRLYDSNDIFVIGYTGFNGSIDEVAVWNISLSDAEIASLYDYTKSSFYPVFQNRTLSDGTYIWNVLGVDNISNYAWANSNYSFTIGNGLQCGNLTDANTVYTLSSNVSIAGDTCFSIQADNVTLDCDGYSITGDNTSSTYGVYSYDLFNTTVMNCLVSNFGTGVYLGRAINGTIINTIASTTQPYSGLNGAGIYIYDFSYNNRIINSTGNATIGNGMVLYWAYNTTISNSTGISNFADGIYLTSANENTLYNFTGISNTERGIMIYSSHDNRIINSNGTSNAIGIWLESSNNNAIINSNAFGTHGLYGSILVYNADNSRIENNTVYVGGSGVGIAIMANSDNAKVINSSIINMSSTMSRGIVVSDGSNNAFIDCQGKSFNGSNAANSYGVYSFEYNTTVKNCVISSFDNSIRLFGSNNGSFINNTLNARTGGVHVYLNGTSSRNTFLLNNFTATTGSYVNDLNGSNYYNGTFAGLNQGNIWANVINGTVSIAGTTASSIPGLTMGTAGTGYPYSNTTSLGKFSCNFASCADYAPLTNNLLPIVTLISPTVTTASTPFFVSSITDNQEVINATIYTNESGWAARETRWNGEVAWNSTGLVALYHFNNESAYSESITNIYDFTGHGHTATTYGSPQIHNGRLGNALNLTGANMAAYAPDDPAFNLTIFTVSAWIVPHVAQSDNVRFVDKGYENSWFFGIGTGSGLDTAVWLNNTNVADSGEVLTIGVWQHVVATYNGSNVTIYLNGNSVASGLYTNEIVGSNYALEIGGRAGAGGGNFNGSIDEVAIWNRSLSSTEIAALYDYSRTSFYPVFQKRVLNAGTNITWNVLAYDNQSNAAFASSNYSFLFQPIWNVFSFITPTMAHTNDTLLGYCQGNTSDSSTTLKYHYLWYRSNTPNATGSVSGIVNGTIVNVNNVSAASTTKDDAWILSCRVEQFGSNSSWVNSTAVNILNTAPVVTSSRIEPSTAYADDTLLGYCTATDVDSDTMTYHYRWFRNGVVNNTGSRTSIASGVEINVGNISASNLFINDVWEIECRADDLSVNSTAVNSTSLTISNYLPIVEFVTLNATSANNLTTDTLTVHFNQSDADGTAVYNITDWRRNNQSIAVLNMPFNTNFTATSNTTSGIIDYSIFANNASLGNSTAGTQPTWTTLGKIGGAYKFDGIDDFIRFNGPAPWNTLNNLTVSFWLNHTNSTTLQYVFNKYVSVNDGWGMRFTGSDGNWLAVVNDIDNAGDTNVGGSTVNPGVWYHVVAQMTQVNATHYENRVYVNGAETGTRYNSSGSWASYDGTLYLGTIITANFLNGTIDELQIFNRSLSSDQINAIYQAGLSNHSLDTIVNNETLPGEEWITCVTPSDGYDDGTTQCSNTLTIAGLDTVPTVALTSPSGTIASPAFFVSSASDDQEVINATLYTNESGSWAAKETRWNGEINYNLSGLVALYHFNNESVFGENGTYFRDFSPYGNNGSCTTCPDIISGKFSLSPSFTAIGDRIEFGNSSSLKGTANLTFAVWIRSLQNITTITDDTTFLCFYDEPSTFCAYSINYVSSSESVQGGVRNGTSVAWSDSAIKMPNGTWHQVVVRYNGTTVATFVNGIRNNNVEDSLSGVVFNANTTLYLGYSWSTINTTFDEFAIWNRSLSDAEIAALYNYTRTNFYPVFQNRTLANGTYVWNVLTFDNQSQSAWASSNYTFIVGEVDTVPVVSLINPTNDETDVTSLVFFVSNVSDNKEVMNATLYTNESGTFAPVETRWNGEIPWNGSGLVGLWHFNNESAFGENGTRIYDFSGYGNNGTCSGTSCPVYNSSGKFGSAYTYDGTNDIFTFGNSSILNPTQEITITAWARYVQETNYLAIITKDSGELSYWFGLNDYDITAIISDSGAHSGYAETSGLTNLAGNTWYHLALIYNGTHIGLYVNGTLDNTPLAYSGDIFSSTSNVVIGDSSYWTGNEWPGTIDDVAVWNRSLSATEIAALYDYTRTNFYPVFQNRTLANGTYVWNVLAYDNQSQSAWASSTYSFTILPALECGNLDTPNSIYTLTSNVSITGATCFTISAQNVTLNCNGYSITGDNTTTTYGVYTTVFNTTVKNCVVSNFMHGVYYYGADNGTILNTTSYSTHSTGNGIYLYNSAQYNRVLDSLGNSTSYRGIAVITNSNYNSIINSTGVSEANAGIRIDQSSNNIIDGCTGTSISAQGIFLVTDASYNTVRNSYAQTNTGNGAFDMYTRTYYNNITNCVGVVYGNGAGIYLNLNTNYTIVNNFTGISSAGEGIYVYRNNNITIINSSGAGRTGILLQNATEVTVSGSIMSSNSTIGALRLLDSDNNMIVNNTMNGTGTNVEAIEFGVGTYNAYNTFINNTLYSETNLISINSESGNNIFILNNFTATTGAFVNDANGTNYYNGTYAGLNQGNIWANVLNGSVEIIGTTASSKSGLFVGTTGTGYPYSNTTSLGKFSCNFANCADYAPLTNDIGLQCGNLDTPNSIYSLTSSVSINGSTCFDVQAANITLDCNGYSITGNNTAVTYGIYTDQTYTTIKNCFIRNFSREIMFDSGATDSLIYNNTLNHTYPDYAIYLGSAAHRNIISANTIYTRDVGITIYGSNVTLDCQGKPIIGNGSNMGVFATAYNLTVTNCNVSNVTTGVYFSSATNSNIYNTIINSSGSAIYLYPGHYTTINNVTLTGGSTGGGDGIQVRVTNGTSISNVRIWRHDWYGLLIRDSHHGVYSNISVNMTGDGQVGLALTNIGQGSSNNTLNNITVTASVGSHPAISIDGSKNTFNKLNVVHSAGNYAFRIISTGENNSIDCQGGSIQGANATDAIYSTSRNTTVKNCVFRDWDTSIRLMGSSNGLYVNNTFIPKTGSVNVYLNATASGNKFILNNFTATTGAYVNDTNGSNYYNGTYDSLNQGNVWANVLNGSVEIIGITASSKSGLYIGTTGTGYPYTNTTSLGKFSCNFANCADYAPLTNDIGLQCGNLTDANTVYTLTSNVSINGSTCFNVQAQNITLNCDGYGITGNNTAETDGVYSDQFNSTIQNCDIRGFNRGIHYSGATDGLIYNNTVNTSIPGQGIRIVSNSHRNMILSNTIHNGDAWGISVNSGDNVTIDCQGKNMIGSGTRAGIDTYAYNTTIRNCNISNFENAIYLATASYGQISDSSVVASTGQGIYLVPGHYTTINNVTAQSVSGSGIYLRNTNGTKLSNTRVLQQIWYGLLLGGSSHGIFTNISINMTDNPQNALLINTEDIQSINNTFNNLTINTASNSHAAVHVDGVKNSFNKISITQSDNNLGFNIANGANNSIDCQGGSITGSGVSNVYGVYSATYNTTVSNCVISDFGNSIRLMGSSNGQFINNTFISIAGGVHVYLNDTSSGNKFILNNFTATTGAFVNDTNGSNHYNGTYDSLNQGNVWANVLNGSVEIIGITASSKSGLYIGTSGTGYPYSNTTSLGKFSCNFANCADYAPLTTQSDFITVNLTSPPDAWITNADPILECYINAGTSIINATLYTNASGTWSANVTNSSISGNSANIKFNSTTFVQGDYTWNCYACTTNLCTFDPVNRTFHVDTTNPSISFVSPTPGDGAIQSNSTNYAFINVSSSDDTGQHAVVVDFNNSLRLWLTFDNISNSQIVDKSSYKENGTFQFNARLGEGYYGKGVYLDSTGDRVHVDNFMETGNFTNYTIMFWMKIDRLASEMGYTPILLRPISAEWGITLQSSGDVLYFTTNNGSGFNYVRGDTSLQKNTWYHVAAIYNGSYAQIYLNGVPDDLSPEYASGLLPHTEGTLQIGGSGAQNFNGTMDEVMVFNRVLSLQEINASYNANIYKYFNNFTGLTGGNYSYTAYVTDRAGNTNQTSRSFIINSIPTVSNVILNSTSSSNYSSDNLTLHFSQSDSDGDAVYNVTDWRRNGQSIAVLNMPFNTNVSSLTTDAILDYSTYSNDGTLGDGISESAPTWTSAGKVGGAYVFDGLNDSIAITSIANITKNFTMSAWVKFTNVTGWQTIIGRDTNESMQRGAFYLQKEGEIVSMPGERFAICLTQITNICVGGNATHVSYAPYSSTEVVANTWYHVASTYDGIILKLYVNGLLEDQEPYTGEVLSQNSPLLIGSGYFNNATVDRVNGTIDEVQIYNRSLSAEQIYQIYLAGLDNNSLTNIVHNETSVDENWSSCVTASDGKDDSNTVCSNNITIQNGVPTIISSLIFPTVAYVNDTLRGYCNAADPDDVTLYYHFSWFLNGQANASGTSGPFTAGISSNVANISSSQLAVGQNWTLQCIADDLKANSTASNSSVKTIQARTPEKVSLKNPTNLNYTVHDRRPLFEWYVTNHTTQYQINITSSTGCGGNYFNNVTNPTLNFTPTNELCVDTEGPNTHYDWQVRACGDDGCGAWSDNWNFSIEPYVVITIVNDSVNLGSLVLGETKNTTQGTPGPFVLQNDGNVQADLINASSDNSLWTSIGLGTIYYQMKSRSSSEANSFNLTSSITSWTNVGSSNVSLIRQMNYSDAADSAYVDVQVTVPGDEPPGAKQSSIIFSWEQSP